MCGAVITPGTLEATRRNNGHRRGRRGPAVFFRSYDFGGASLLSRPFQYNGTDVGNDKLKVLSVPGGAADGAWKGCTCQGGRRGDFRRKYYPALTSGKAKAGLLDQGVINKFKRDRILHPIPSEAISVLICILSI